jgi:hypothetical protein
VTNGVLVSSLVEVEVAAGAELEDDADVAEVDFEESVGIWLEDVAFEASEVFVEEDSAGDELIGVEAETVPQDANKRRVVKAR